MCSINHYLHDNITVAGFSLTICAFRNQGFRWNTAYSQAPVDVFDQKMWFVGSCNFFSFFYNPIPMFKGPLQGLLVVTCCQYKYLLSPPTVLAHAQQCTRHSVLKNIDWVFSVVAVDHSGSYSSSAATNNVLLSPFSSGTNTPRATHRWSEFSRLPSIHHFQCLLTMTARG